MNGFPSSLFHAGLQYDNVKKGSSVKHLSAYLFVIEERSSERIVIVDYSAGTAVQRVSMIYV